MEGTVCQLGARGVDSVTCIVSGGKERLEKARGRELSEGQTVV